MTFEMTMAETVAQNAQSITLPMVNNDSRGGLCVYGVHIAYAMASTASHEQKAATMFFLQFSLDGQRRPGLLSMISHVHWARIA
jgi:hypothetical protein